MSSATSPEKQNTATMVGDACLFTAAAFCPLAIMGGPLALIIGPSVAWLLHNRRPSRPAVISGGIGLVIGIILVGGVLMTAPLLARAIEPPSTSESTIPVALLAAVGVLFLAVVVALDIQAIRDLLPARRQHVRLDIARLVSTGVIALFAAIVSAVQLANPATEVGEAGIFALGAAAVGAVTMAVANALHGRWKVQSTS